MPTDAFHALGTSMAKVYPWLKANNGPGGSFIAARAAAEREQRLQVASQEAAIAGHLPAPAGAALRFDQKLLEAKTLAKQDPKLVANVIRDWVDGRER